MRLESLVNIFRSKNNLVGKKVTKSNYADKEVLVGTVEDVSEERVRIKEDTSMSCSFCEKKSAEVEYLIGGEVSNTHICNECINFTKMVLDEKRNGSQE